MTNNKIYKCEDCGLHYENEQHAKDCHAFCAKHNACSVEITKYSIEAKAKIKESKGSKD